MEIGSEQISDDKPNIRRPVFRIVDVMCPEVSFVGNNIHGRTR